MSIAPGIPLIVRAVAKAKRVPVEEVTLGRKAGLLSEPRKIAAYLATTLTDLSASDIGMALGGLAPWVVSSAYGQVAIQWREDHVFREHIKDLSIEILAEAKARQVLGIPPQPGLDAVAIAREVSSGRLPVTSLSVLEILAIASGLAALAGAGGSQPKEASYAR